MSGLNDTYTVAPAGRKSRQCAAVRKTVGEMRLPLQYHSSNGWMRPSPLKSVRTAPTLANELAPVGVPPMMKFGAAPPAPGAVGGAAVSVAQAAAKTVRKTSVEQTGF